MFTWWGGLGALHRTFYIAAVFFSTLFIWQLFSAVSGLGGGDEELGTDSGVGVDGADGDGVGADDLTEDLSGLATFRMLSVRSILAFGTLFSWAGALYLGRTLLPIFAVLRAFLWGIAGMLVVALFFWLLPRMSEQGNSDLRTAVGQTGTVYLTIPEDGTGQVRVTVSGALQFIKARSHHGRPITAGTPVRVTDLLDTSTLEVEELEV